MKQQILPQCTPVETESDLWGERSEWLEYDYPTLILVILRFDKIANYDRIKAMLNKYGYPTDLGFVVRAISVLLRDDKIEVARSGQRLAACWYKIKEQIDE